MRSARACGRSGRRGARRALRPAAARKVPALNAMPICDTDSLEFARHAARRRRPTAGRLEKSDRETQRERGRDRGFFGNVSVHPVSSPMSCSRSAADAARRRRPVAKQRARCQSERPPLSGSLIHWPQACLPVSWPRVMRYFRLRVNHVGIAPCRVIQRVDRRRAMLLHGRLVQRTLSVTSPRSSDGGVSISRMRATNVDPPLACRFSSMSHCSNTARTAGARSTSVTDASAAAPPTHGMRRRAETPAARCRRD